MRSRLRFDVERTRPHPRPEPRRYPTYLTAGPVQLNKAHLHVRHHRGRLERIYSGEHESPDSKARSARFVKGVRHPKEAIIAQSVGWTEPTAGSGSANDTHGRPLFETAH